MYDAATPSEPNAARPRATARAAFERSFEAAPLPQAMLGAAGEILAVNAAFASLVRRGHDGLIGLRFMDLVLPRDAGPTARALQRTDDGPVGHAQVTGARLLRGSDRSVHCELHMTGLADETTSARTIVQAIDQTERDQYESELRQIASHDSLTGLLNRRGFRERVADSLSSGRRRNESRTLLLVDVDHFKTINDLHGHAVGDAMLRAIADQIRAVAGEHDPASRIAGDEFAVLCVDGSSSARVTAERLLALVRAQAAEARACGRPPLTVSIGLAEVNPVMDTVDDVLMRADLALYEAKEWGRDCLVEASAGVLGSVRRADRILEDLQQAIRAGGFVLHAQPILDLSSRRVTQHEMLARLASDSGATLAPADFLPVAERHGLVAELDRWVLTKTVRLLGAQRSQGRSLPRLHVNLAAGSVEHPELVERLAHELRRHDVPGRHLVLELTEASRVVDLDVLERFARRLADVGCGLALDDFGAGGASLLQLRDLPLDYVKIDGCLARDAAASDRAASLVQGLASTARGLGVRSVAQHVDTAACLARLPGLGLDFAQGFQVGVPRALAANGRPARRHVATATPRVTGSPAQVRTGV